MGKHFPDLKAIGGVKFLRHCAAAFAALALAACGGGGEAGAPAPAAATATPLSITSFTPTSGPVGSTVTVSGTGFSGLAGARLDGVTATYTVGSDTQAQVVVPITAASGRIEFTAAGQVSVSASDFTVTGIPVLSSVTPTTVMTGGRLTLTGTSLDLVRDVRLNGTLLTIATRSATSIAADVPAGATSGVLTLVDTSGVARAQSQQITVAALMSVSSFAPATVLTGQSLTINGANLDRAVSVLFAGGATAVVASRTASTQIVVQVPDTAATGVFRVRGNVGDEVAAAAPLTVTPAIRVNPAAIYRVASVGVDVTITGTGLTEVSGVEVGGVTATVVSRTATQLVFTVPAGVVCAAIVLNSASQPAAAAGSVIVGSGCVATLAGVEFAQVLSQPANDARQRIAPAKETWARVFVLSTQSGVPAPTVRVTGFSGATALGTLTAIGPATLPVSAGATVPDTVRTNETQSFNVELPLAWVATGLSLRVEVDPEMRLGPPSALDVVPMVGTSTRLEVVLVPVHSGTFVPTVPATAVVIDEIVRRFPVPRANIAVSVRAPHVLTSVTDGLDTSTEWSDALSELNQLRAAENPNNPYRYYFGFVRRSGGSIAGIGYLPGRAALGYDGVQWARTMSHELGHNLTRPHAPCGGPASPDPNYPYTGGALGPTPLVDSIPAALDVISPAGQSDIMGYCSGVWFSDYNYREMQRHLESQPQAMAVATSAGAVSDLLLISGTIGVNGVVLAPVQALRGFARISGGAYMLRILTSAGETIEQAFDAELVDHADPPESHFSVIMRDPGPLARLQVLQNGIPLPARGAGLARAQSLQPAAPQSAINTQWSESGGELELNWNTAAASFATVTFVNGGERTVLVLNRGGGQLKVPTAGLPAGGEFEFSFSDGLNARLVRVAR